MIELGGHGELVDAVDTVRRGPRGGNLNARGITQSLVRRAPHEGIRLDNGVLSLHKFVETTAPGKHDEQPWHRMAALMMVAKIPNRTIASAAGVHEVTISQLKAQRWFQELLATLATEQGLEVLNVVKGEALASVSKLIALRDSAGSERVQLAAATTLLEHAEGKPVQRNLNVTASTTFSNPQEEYSALQQELETLRKRNS